MRIPSQSTRSPTESSPAPALDGSNELRARTGGISSQRARPSLGSLFRRRTDQLIKDHARLAFYTMLLFATVASIVVPAVVLQPNSRISLLKLAVVVLLGSMPGLLYIQFVRFKGHSLYDEYVINLFRLRIDRYCNLPAPPKHTSYYREWKADHRTLTKPGPDNLYRRKFEAVYGQAAVSTRDQFATGVRPARSNEAFYPVLLTTALLCIGWATVVQPELFRSFDLLGILPFSGRPELPYDALRFGFLGAYWFILQDLIRRYFRQDLKTKAYVSATARIVVVAIVVTAVSVVPVGSPAQQMVFAFFIGIFPLIGVQLLKAGVHVVFKRAVPALSVKHPLSDLDGLTIWDQARLLEEGVEDLQSLTTANIVDLLLGTRVPVNRLIDWLDQALLFLHVVDCEEAPDRRKRLRALGIRTATDLQRIWHSSAGPNTVAKRRLVAAALSTDVPHAATVETILASLEGHPNLVHVKAFRGHTWLPEDARP
jgi:hypothetical protein